MKNSIFSIISIALIAVVFYTCKKEDISNQQLAEKHIIGRWPLRLAINIIRKNGVITKNDTLFYGLDSPKVVLPTDTLLFTPEGKCIKGGKEIGYTIDATGDNLTYSEALLGTWKIKYLRLKSIILTQEKTEQTGADTFNYYKEEQLIK